MVVFELTFIITQFRGFVYPLKQSLTNQEPVSKVDDLFSVVEENRELRVYGDDVELVETDSHPADREVLTDLSVVAEVFHLFVFDLTFIITQFRRIVYPLKQCLTSEVVFSVKQFVLDAEGILCSDFFQPEVLVFPPCPAAEVCEHKLSDVTFRSAEGVLGPVAVVLFFSSADKGITGFCHYFDCLLEFHFGCFVFDLTIIITQKGAVVYPLKLFVTILSALEFDVDQVSQEHNSQCLKP